MAALPIDIDAVGRAKVAREPFPYFMVPGFVRHEALDGINARLR